MKLPEARQAYYELSGKASDLVRQFAFAGIAIVWVFSGSSLTQGKLAIADDLLRVGITLVVVLALDLLQYVLGAAVWAGWARLHERAHVTETEDVDAARSLNWPANACYWMKMLGVLTAYVMLLVALVNRLN